MEFQRILRQGCRRPFGRRRDGGRQVSGAGAEAPAPGRSAKTKARPRRRGLKGALLVLAVASAAGAAFALNGTPAALNNLTSLSFDRAPDALKQLPSIVLDRAQGLLKRAPAVGPAGRHEESNPARLKGAHFEETPVNSVSPAGSRTGELTSSGAASFDPRSGSAGRTAVRECADRDPGCSRRGGRTASRSIDQVRRRARADRGRRIVRRGPALGILAACAAIGQAFHRRRQRQAARSRPRGYAASANSAGYASKARQAREGAQAAQGRGRAAGPGRAPAPQPEKTDAVTRHGGPANPLLRAMSNAFR